MPRPMKNRKIYGEPPYSIFKPVGVPTTDLETITLTLDELEAMRLADFEGLYQEESARLMEVSRQTFGNIISNARRKCAEAFLQGKQILIEGGEIEIDYERRAICNGCGRTWRSLKGTGRGRKCPASDLQSRRRHRNGNPR